ncbi:MAG: FmdB family zinc ribbon protein [Halodesulfovibrio sp.]
MPIYEYRCNACEQIFEEWQKSFEDTHPDCPVCGGSSERVMSNTTFVLKGGGWYVSEYGRNSASSHSDNSAAAASNGGNGGNGGSNGAGGNGSSDNAGSAPGSGATSASGTSDAVASGGTAS